MLPCELLRDGARLFDVSMWCLGRDVLCPEGNLLARRGLVRHVRPEGVEGQSAYTVDLPGGGRLVMWGFGVLCECGEAVFVPRDGFTPRLLDAAPAQPVFRAQDLGSWREPATAPERRAAREGLATLAGWLAGYEAWVVEEVGLEWRRTCVEVRRKASPVAPDTLSSAWRRLASRVRSLDSGFNVCAAPGTGA
ncbi:hypothetical protein [Pyxidicoccus xibeiensis]|uniref:hypothetical protein n=1 Tax=Pyxidicoccus xibeiensis TaxID=2906759 RepID=UPI0020A7FF4A|nr:hypothetical protein [Pyxidicoccus xibeiensis]MCP3142569.1 hypothetical protein [Pyxidicoccus xibeiensis]